MAYDIQKAGLSKRFAAGLFDIILLVVLITGIAWGVSVIVDTDGKYQAVQNVYTVYGEKHGIDFNISAEDMATMPTEEQEKYNDAYNAALKEMNEDQEAVALLMEYWYAMLASISLSVLGGHLILEFAVPLFLKNGQTVGKKIFGIALMRKDGVQVSAFAMFVRSLLGKCTVEVMVPVMVLFMLFMGIGGILIYLVLILAAVQTGLLFLHPTKSLLHDLMACTVAVDLSSQLIFADAEEKLAFEQKLARERAERADY